MHMSLTPRDSNYRATGKDPRQINALAAPSEGVEEGL